MNPIGPEEPSVYWRRRLLVGLGVLVVLILLFLVLRACTSDAEPTAASSQSAQPTVEPSASETGLEGLCPDSAIEVEVTPNNGTEFAAGTPITFTMSIKNVSDAACERNVGTLPNTVLVESAGTQVWSSDDCAPPGQDDIKTLEPGDVFQLNATWDQKQTQPGCPAGQPSVQPGSYEAIGVNDQVKSTPAPFTIT